MDSRDSSKSVSGIYSSVRHSSAAKVVIIPVVAKHSMKV